MLSGVLVMGGLGIVIGVALALASKIFYVYVDPKIEAVDEALPGANCGGCGYPGCSSNAVAIVAGESSASSCVAGGPEIADEIAALLGVKLVLREPEFAGPGCRYGVQDADIHYQYQGIQDCRAAVLLSGGSKVCPIGCIGLGTCVRACPFDALSMGPDGLPVVNKDLCTGCGTCERICPKHIITLTSTSLRMTNEYNTEECTAPCQRACPTGINIPGFIHEIRDGNHEKALDLIKEKCPLPLICGYICPAPCEVACRRNLVEDAVAINPLKRFAADYEMHTGKSAETYKAPDTGHKIALVGGGAEGLTAAYYLARLGYHPTIFEAKPELGGILRYVIAEDRLPRKVLDHDIEGILQIGVEARTNALLGRDFTVSSLFQEGFGAVLLTKGGFDSRKILQPESKTYDVSVEGLYTMLDFLALTARDEVTNVGKRVVIAHGGFGALDLARKCRELGAQEVTIIATRQVQLLPQELQEIKALMSEGIQVRPGTMVVELKGISERLTHVSFEDAASGNGMPGERETIEVDTLIVAAGRIPELVFVPETNEEDDETHVKGWRTLDTFRTFPGSGAGRGIFSSPEPGRVSDSSAVVKSLLSGRRLTRAIHQHFAQEQIFALPQLTCEAGYVLDVTEVHDVGEHPRQNPAVSDVEGDSKSAWIFPVEFPGLDETAARQEAKRCLQCGLICYLKEQ